MQVGKLQISLPQWTTLECWIVMQPFGYLEENVQPTLMLLLNVSSHRITVLLVIFEQLLHQDLAVSSFSPESSRTLGPELDMSRGAFDE